MNLWAHLSISQHIVSHIINHTRRVYYWAIYWLLTTNYYHLSISQHVWVLPVWYYTTQHIEIYFRISQHIFSCMSSFFISNLGVSAYRSLSASQHISAYRVTHIYFCHPQPRKLSIFQYGWYILVWQYPDPSTLVCLEKLGSCPTK